MQPFTVILGIILGSLVAIGFSLTVVLFLFWLLQGDYPRVASELPELARSTTIFSILAGLAAAGFLGTLHRRAWRYLALGLLWLGLGATGWYYWPA